MPDSGAGYHNGGKGEGIIDDAWGSALETPVTRAEIIRIWSRILQSKDVTSVNTVNSLPDVSLPTPYFAEIALSIMNRKFAAGRFGVANNRVVRAFS